MLTPDRIVELGEWVAATASDSAAIHPFLDWLAEVDEALGFELAADPRRLDLLHIIDRIGEAMLDCKHGFDDVERYRTMVTLNTIRRYVRQQVVHVFDKLQGGIPCEPRPTGAVEHTCEAKPGGRPLQYLERQTLTVSFTAFGVSLRLITNWASDRCPYCQRTLFTPLERRYVIEGRFRPLKSRAPSAAFPLSDSDSGTEDSVGIG